MKDIEGTLLVYIPLSLTSDQVGDSPVAFRGQMLYRPTSDDFGLVHKARLAWTLQMLQDTCNTAAMPESFPHPEKPGETVQRIDDKAVALWCLDSAHWVEQMGVIHTYYEDWYLTGMSVREDHGMEVAVIHEDPMHYLNGAPPYENNLTRAQGLDAAPGRRADATGERDLTIAEIQRRFDRDSNTGVSMPSAGHRPARAGSVTYISPSQIHLGVIPRPTPRKSWSAFTRRSAPLTCLFSAARNATAPLACRKASRACYPTII